MPEFFGVDERLGLPVRWWLNFNKDTSGRPEYLCVMYLYLLHVLHLLELDYRMVGIIRVP